jgi:hypothetical protein
MATWMELLVAMVWSLLVGNEVTCRGSIHRTQREVSPEKVNCYSTSAMLPETS